MKHIVCLGYAKCGTTMLDVVFRQSRIVATPLERKEIKFFLPRQYPEQNQYREYLRQFFGDAAAPDAVTHTFEASPPYCHQSAEEFAAVLARIDHTLPDSEVVICVRHPVARAYSHYIHNLHGFALYGEGVYGSRPLLPNRIYRKTFEQSLHDRPRIMARYHDCLRTAIDVFGAKRVKLFFLESDTRNFRDWVIDLVGEKVAVELRIGTEPPKTVIPRRPVPNYTVRDGVLIAFGSRKGELVPYRGLSHVQRRAIIDSRKSWTLELDERDITRMVQEYFGEDLQECAALTGDTRFTDYLTRQPEKQAAGLTPGKLLPSVHRLKPDATPDSIVEGP